MHVQFQYTFNDYVEANRRHLWVSRGATIMWLVVAPLLVAGFILMAIDGSNNISSTSVLSYIPILILFGLWSPWGRRLLVYVRWKRQPALQAVLSYEITDASVVVTTDTSRSEMKWEIFTRFRESKNLFILYAGRYLFYMIPKRAFAGETELESFRELALNKVPAKR